MYGISAVEQSSVMCKSVYMCQLVNLLVSFGFVSIYNDKQKSTTGYKQLTIGS